MERYFVNFFDYELSIWDNAQFDTKEEVEQFIMSLATAHPKEFDIDDFTIFKGKEIKIDFEAKYKIELSN